MKRTGFKPRRPVKATNPREGEFESWRPTPRPVAQAIRVYDGKARLVVQIPKPEPVKPGKRAPTIEERAWMDAITTIGCIACLLDGRAGVPGAVHHLLRGGRRIGHLSTICLCDPGHHQNGQQFGLVSRHPWKARFEERYGSEEALLQRSRELVSAGKSHAPVLTSEIRV